MQQQPPLGAETLKKIGLSLKTACKSLGVSAIAKAEPEGNWRVILYRVENGTPTASVSAFVQ